MKQIELAPDLALDQVLQHAQQEDVVLTRQGHAVALISEIDDDELYWYSRERDAEFLASLSRAREQIKNGQAVDHQDLKRQLGIESIHGPMKGRHSKCEILLGGSKPLAIRGVSHGDADQLPAGHHPSGGQDDSA